MSTEKDLKEGTPGRKSIWGRGRSRGRGCRGGNTGDRAKGDQRGLSWGERGPETGGHRLDAGTVAGDQGGGWSRKSGHGLGHHLCLIYSYIPQIRFTSM